jgi:hypothetical protein
MNTPENQPKKLFFAIPEASLQKSEVDVEEILDRIYSALFVGKEK